MVELPPEISTRPQTFETRMKPPYRILSAVLLGGTLLALPSAARAADWPWWLGPDRDGISKETAWSVEGKEEPLWQKNVGIGYSTVSIADGRLYTQGHDEEAQEDTIFCLDPLTGEEKWSYSFPSQTWNRGHGGGALSTPSIDGDRVFASHREGNFFCFEAATGEVVWKMNLEKEYGLENATWGFAAAPLVFEDTVVMNSGWVLALNKKDGKLLWKSERDYGDAYSTPAPFVHGGKECLAVFGGDGLAVIERKKGEEIAFHEWKTRYDVNAATPVVIGEDRIFISSGYGHGCALLKLEKKELKPLWENKLMKTQMSGPVLYRDHLYGYDDSKLQCLDLAGEEKWSERLGKAALVLADGKIIGLSSRGELVIAEAKPEGYAELYRRKILDGGVYWTTPVLCNGLIYCRNSQGDLACLDHRAE